MQHTGRSDRLTGRNIDRRMVALGVIGFFVLAGVFFSLGFFYIGPRIQFPARTERQPGVVYTPPRFPRAVPPPERDAEGTQPPLDVEITERKAEDGAAGGRTSAEEETSGVTQGEKGLTLTLEPKEDEARPASGEAAPSIPERRADGGTTGRTEPKRREPSGGAAVTFRVQVGTFESKASAETLASELRERGYRARIAEVQVEGRTLFRVQVGEFKTREAAGGVADDLSKVGYSPSVVADKKAE